MVDLTLKMIFSLSFLFSRVIPSLTVCLDIDHDVFTFRFRWHILSLPDSKFWYQINIFVGPIPDLKPIVSQVDATIRLTRLARLARCDFLARCTCLNSTRCWSSCLLNHLSQKWESQSNCSTVQWCSNFISFLFEYKWYVLNHVNYFIYDHQVKEIGFL